MGIGVWNLTFRAVEYGIFRLRLQSSVPGIAFCFSTNICTQRLVQKQDSSSVVQLATAELSLRSSLRHSPIPALPGADQLVECGARAGPVPTIPNDCTHKKGFNSLSQLSPRTAAREERTAQDSLKPTTTHPPTLTHPLIVCTHPPLLPLPLP